MANIDKLLSKEELERQSVQTIADYACTAMAAYRKELLERIERWFSLKKELLKAEEKPTTLKLGSDLCLTNADDQQPIIYSMYKIYHNDNGVLVLGGGSPYDYDYEVEVSTLSLENLISLVMDCIDF